MSVSQPSATFNSLPDARKRAAPRTWNAYTAAVIARLRCLAPYVAIELVMPGGSMMALLLWLYRRHSRALIPVAGSEVLRRVERPLASGARPAQSDVALVNHSRIIGSSKA